MIFFRPLGLQNEVLCYYINTGIRITFVFCLITQKVGCGGKKESMVTYSSTRKLTLMHTYTHVVLGAFFTATNNLWFCKIAFLESRILKRRWEFFCLKHRVMAVVAQLNRLSRSDSKSPLKENTAQFTCEKNRWKRRRECKSLCR